MDKKDRSQQQVSEKQQSALEALLGKRRAQESKEWHAALDKAERALASIRGQR